MSNNSGARVCAVEVEGESDPFEFNVTQADFGRFLRESQRDVAAAANNMLLATCVDQPRLKKAFDADWGLALTIMGGIQDELIEVRNVTVKKLKTSPPN